MMIINFQMKLRLIQLIKMKIVLIPLSTLLILYMLFFNIVRIHECTLNYNFFSGEVVLDTVPGIKIKSPWVLVSNIDTRPIRVCIDCSCNNVTCELVRFNPNGYKSFLEKEGWSYYWFRNRLSFNSGNNMEWRGMNNIIRGYSFDEKSYEFITYENSKI